MYIKSLRIQNYRLFYGNHNFRFDFFHNKSLNIIFGKNGVGKSSLIDSIHWCLYGNEMREIGSEPIYNSSLAEEISNGDEFDVFVVILIIDDLGREISIKRTISFYKSEEEVLLRNNDFTIFLNDMLVSAPTIFIHKFFSKFLFELTYVNGENILSSNNFEGNIKSLLAYYFQLNIIDRAKIHLKKSYDKFIINQKKINSDLYLIDEHGELSKKYDEVCSKIENCENDINELENLLHKYHMNLSSADFKKRDVLISELKSIDDRIMRCESDYSYLVCNSFPLAILVNDLESNSNLHKVHFEEYLDENDLKNPFSFNLKNDLTDLNKDIVRISNYIKEISHLKNKYIKIADEITSINDSLSVNEPLISEIEFIENKLTDSVKSNAILKNEKKALKNKLSALDKKINVIKVKSKGSEKKHDFYKNILESLNFIGDNQFRNILVGLSNSINNIFIHDFGMDEFFSNIIIDDDFRFKIVKNSGKIINFSDLSHGDKYVFYLSFILSIQRVIDQDIFLIIDTQFLNFDSERWLNFLSLLKRNNYQCFLLFNEKMYDTNTKFKLMDNINVEYELFNNSDKIKVIQHENDWS